MIPGIQLAVARYFVCESDCNPKLELLPHEMVYFFIEAMHIIGSSGSDKCHCHSHGLSCVHASIQSSTHDSFHHVVSSSY